MRRLAIALVVAMAAGCGGSAAPVAQSKAPHVSEVVRHTAAPKAKPGAVSRAGMGAAWPLTVDAGTVACQDGVDRIFTTAAGKTYGLNGTAKTDGFPGIDPIWAANPAAAGLKKDLGPLLDVAGERC